MDFILHEQSLMPVSSPNELHLYFHFVTEIQLNVGFPTQVYFGTMYNTIYKPHILTTSLFIFIKKILRTLSKR